MKTGVHRIAMRMGCLAAFLTASFFILSAGPRETRAAENFGLPGDVAGHVLLEETQFDYAQEISIGYYEGGWKLYEVRESACYLQAPAEEVVPEDLPEDVILLPEEPENTYLAATAAMSLVNAAGALDRIRFSSQTAENWYVPEAAAAMQEGSLVFAGKYSEPDYELLLGQDCDLAVESTMILHTPKVKEKLESLGIPVFVDRSSYENHPLGRTEWVKVYGALFGCEEEAEQFFRSQAEKVESLGQPEMSGKKIAFFYINPAGIAVVRRTDDYVPEMIRMAGGTYVPENAAGPQDSHTSTINMTMEDFYAGAKDADCLIYNASIDAPLDNIGDLTAKNPLFADFKAVKEGNVWCTDQYLYQAADRIGDLILEFNAAMTRTDDSGLQFLKKIDFQS